MCSRSVTTRSRLTFISLVQTLQIAATAIFNRILNRQMVERRMF